MTGAAQVAAVACERCGEPAPTAKDWRRCRWRNHCSFDCYYLDEYEEALEAAAAEGLHGRALRQRAGVLFLERTTTQERQPKPASVYRRQRRELRRAGVKRYARA